MFTNRSIVVERHLALRYSNRNQASIVNYFVSSYFLNAFGKKRDSHLTVPSIRVL